MLIDTHAHLYVEAFDEDRDQMMTRAIEQKVNKIVLANIDLDSIEPMLKMCESYQTCFPTLGLHPCSVKSDWEEVLKRMEAKLANHSFVAIGETGIDLYWDKSTLDWQIQALDRQVEWSKDTALPIIIHARDSLDELIAFFQSKGSSFNGVFHCFTGSLEQGQKIIDLGFHLGVGGVATFKNSGMGEVLAELPLNKMVLETDAPYLSPTPLRGKRNESAFMVHVLAKLSLVKGLELVDVERITTETAEKLFGI